MPFDTLKLDKAVVSAAPRHPQAAAFIAGIVHHANARNMTVTAEGVEDQDMWDMVRMLGVHAAQGYLIGEPMHAVAISHWLEDWSEPAPR